MLRKILAVLGCVACGAMLSAQIPAPGVKIRNLPACASPAGSDLFAAATSGGITCAETAAQITAGLVPSTRTLSCTAPLLCAGTTSHDLSSNFALSLSGTFAGSASNGGPATTALALNATPTLCSAGQAPLGVLANGNSTGCFTPASSITFTPPSLFSVSGSPGAAITLSWQSLAANTIVANNTGGSAGPTAVAQSSILHNSFGGLTTGDPHTQYALLAGRAGGTVLDGGPSSSDFLQLVGSSANAGENLTLDGNFSNLNKNTANGAQMKIGQMSELLTFNATPKDTTASLLPANSVIRAVVLRVVTSLTGSCSAFNVGDPTTASRFSASVGVTSGTTAIGLTHVDQTGAAGPKQTSAATVRLTCTSGTPSGGTVRITVFYEQFAAPTS